MESVVHFIVALFVLAVVVGALVQVLNSPAHANTLIASGADVITGVTRGLEPSQSGG